MKVLFISNEMIAGDLAYRLKLEGCDVKLFIKDKSRSGCLENMVEKTDDWRKELNWVGKKGLIIFDDVGYGRIQDSLRRKGYSVVGGSGGGDKMEKDREFGQNVLQKYGIKPVETINFSSIKEAIDFIESNKKSWVLKQNNHSCSLSYVGMMEDGSDVRDVLEQYNRNLPDRTPVSLQKKVSGIEIGVGRYFNGNDWVGPIEVNIEHKRLFNGEIGPLTGEMGTLSWYEEKENRLFSETLSKIKPYLKEVDFRGDIDINCIVDENNAYPLEVTSRFGCPSTHLQEELHLSGWKFFLSAVAKGEAFDLEYKKEFGIVVSVAIQPFPYKSISSRFYLKGARIFFDDSVKSEDLKSIHFEEVSLRGNNGKEKFCVSGNNGYILYVSGSGKTVLEAREKTYGLVNKLMVPNMFYRTDIGAGYIESGEKFLKTWGWI